MGITSTRPLVIKWPHVLNPGWLYRGLIKTMERVTGIEPAWPAWKAGALPLSYTRKRC
jgi:hypothetical protein